MAVPDAASLSQCPFEDRSTRFIDHRFLDQQTTGTSIHVPLQGEDVGEVGSGVDVYFHDRVHPLTPPLIRLAVRQALPGLLDVVRLEVPEEGEAITRPSWSLRRSWRYEPVLHQPHFHLRIALPTIRADRQVPVY